MTAHHTTAQRLAAEAAATSDPRALLAATAAAVRLAGQHLLALFDPHTRTPPDRAAIVRTLHAHDEVSLALARGLLHTARPDAGWVEDELEGGALPPGEWWVFDPVEGNVNHAHGLAEWGVSATLVRDNAPVLTAVYEPLADRLFTAMRHGGAFLDGMPMRPSVKSELRAAMLTTGQARPDESPETYRRLGESVTAMLKSALVVRMTVPATFQLALVAGGQIDGFWQYSDVRSGLAAGALLVAEAGGVVTDTRGAPWTLASPDFLATAPGIHQAVVTALHPVA